MKKPTNQKFSTRDILTCTGIAVCRIFSWALMLAVLTLAINVALIQIAKLANTNVLGAVILLVFGCASSAILYILADGLNGAYDNEAD